MKNIIIALSILITLNANGNDYYFSSTGSDNATGTQSDPFQTIAKFNSLNLKPGDNVYFHNGETFVGAITLKSSGTTEQPVYIGTYGEGAKATITGFANLTNWTNVGGGKYESNVTLPSPLNMVTLNDKEQEMGRWPNSDANNGGYLNFETHNLKTAITDIQLINSPNWQGAEMVARTNRYIIDRTKITKQVGTTLTYSPALSYEPLNGFGYFIQNDIRTLDQLGEWFYDNKKMTMYFGQYNPSSISIRAASVNNLIYVYDYDNIVFDGLNLTGANNYGIYLYSASNITIKNCDVSYSGIDGIQANNVGDLKIEGCNISTSNNIGINLSNSVRGTLRANHVINSGLVIGMGQNTANKSLGIRETGNTNTIINNSVENSGYIGIRFGGDNTVVKNNFVNRYNLTKDDGAGIYTTDNGVGRKIIGNIVLNGIGAAAGTNNPVAASTHGIYLDDDTNDVTVDSNTVANNNKSGILLHNAHEIALNGNTIFNNPIQLYESHNMTSPSAPPLRNNAISDNTFFSKTADQTILSIYTVKNDVNLAAGDMNNNLYARPLDDGYTIKTQFVNSAGTSTIQDMDLNLWQKTYGKDLRSTVTSQPIVSHKVNGLIGINKFANGSFDKDIKGITFGTTGNNAVKSWVNKIDGGTLQLAVASTKPGITTITFPVGPVSADKKYIINFTVQNSKDTLLYVYARQAGSPYKVLSNNAVKNIINIGARKDYEIAFTPTVNNTSTSIFLDLPAQYDTLLVDNFKVYEADVSITNADDSIKLVYNASRNEAVSQLPGKYIDSKGIEYNGDISLQPYTSAVLIRKGDIYIPPVDTIPIPPIDTIPVDTIPSISLVSQNDTLSSPANIHLVAKISNVNVKKVQIFNGKTLLHTEWSAPYEFVWTNIPAGKYSFIAKVVDKNNKITTSSPVVVIVIKTQ